MRGRGRTFDWRFLAALAVLLAVSSLVYRGYRADADRAALVHTLKAQQDNAVDARGKATEQRLALIREVDHVQDSLRRLVKFLVDQGVTLPREYEPSSSGIASGRKTSGRASELERGNNKSSGSGGVPNKGTSSAATGKGAAPDAPSPAPGTAPTQSTPTPAPPPPSQGPVGGFVQDLLDLPGKVLK